MTEPPSKSLAQLAREAAQSDSDAWICPRCGCKDWRVVDTRWTVGGGPRRIRACRNCHQKMPGGTIEVPIPPGVELRILQDHERDVA